VITGIVLAAGRSSRFGTPKQLSEHRGKPLGQHAVDAAVEAGLDEVVVVVGYEAERVRSALRLPSNGRAVSNPSFDEGLSTSLAVGLGAAAPESEGAVVLLADQPEITAEHIRALVTAFVRNRARIVRLRFRDGPGPSLLSREVWKEALGLIGDTGARALIDPHPDWVEEVRVDADAPADIDTRADLERLEP
jgi:molybdenum cofactor cytidylyltransferase